MGFPLGLQYIYFINTAFRVYTSFLAYSLDILNTHFNYLIIRSILKSILIITIHLGRLISYAPLECIRSVVHILLHWVVEYYPLGDTMLSHDSRYPTRLQRFLNLHIQLPPSRWGTLVDDILSSTVPSLGVMVDLRYSSAY